jgi:hypothetical protein
MTIHPFNPIPSAKPPRSDEAPTGNIFTPFNNETVGETPFGLTCQKMSPLINGLFYQLAIAADETPFKSGIPALLYAYSFIVYCATYCIASDFTEKQKDALEKEISLCATASIKNALAAASSDRSSETP